MHNQILMVAILATTGCVGEVHRGNGVEATEARTVGSFSEVSANGPFDVAVSTGAPTVEVTCDENLLPDITTEVQGDTLVIGTREEDGTWILLAPEAPCHVRVSTPTLRGVGATGSGWLIVRGEAPDLAEVHSTGSGGVLVEPVILASALRVTATGSGEIELETIEVGAVELEVVGSGRVAIGGGSADSLTAQITGSGDLDAPALVVDRADVTISGSGGAELTVTGSLEALLTGSGSLVIHGDPPERDVNTTGSGDVRFE